MTVGGRIVLIFKNSFSFDYCEINKSCFCTALSCALLWSYLQPLGAKQIRPCIQVPGKVWNMGVCSFGELGELHGKSRLTVYLAKEKSVLLAIDG